MKEIIEKLVRANEEMAETLKIFREDATINQNMFMELFERMTKRISNLENRVNELKEK